MVKRNIEKIIEYAKSEMEFEINGYIQEIKSSILREAFGLAGFRMRNANEKIKEANEMGLEIRDYSSEINNLKEMYREHWSKCRDNNCGKEWY